MSTAVMSKPAREFALVSPYAKADMTRRLLAATVDGMLVATVLVPYRHSESQAYVLAGAAFLEAATIPKGSGKLTYRTHVRYKETGDPGGHK